MAVGTIQSAANIAVYAGTSTGPSTCVGLMTSADLTLNGKNVDTTHFDCTSPPTFTQNKQTIKDAKCVLKGFLDKTDDGQALIWAEFVGGLGTLWIKVTFDVGGTHYFNGPMAVDSIGVGEKASGGLVEVTYNMSSNGTAFFDATS